MLEDTNGWLGQKMVRFFKEAMHSCLYNEEQARVMVRADVHPLRDDSRGTGDGKLRKGFQRRKLTASRVLDTVCENRSGADLASVALH